MSSGSNPRDEAELEAFLVRKSSLATDYDRLELVEPPAVLDAAILATAKSSAKPDHRAAEPATKPVPRGHRDPTACAGDGKASATTTAHRGDRRR